MTIGSVFLVGAGPGDPGLLTRRGAALLSSADVVVYDGLVNDALLDLAPARCRCIYAGKKRATHGRPHTQAEINELLIEHARAGRRVVRLKGGDSFVFGRGAEECQALAAAGIDFEIVPGVTAATAVPAYAGIPLTARGVTSTVSFATGHEAAGKPETDVDWRALAHAGTIVLFMAVRTMRECCAQLMAAGKSGATPAAVTRWGTTTRQRSVFATLATLPEVAARAGIGPPALVIVGDVVHLRTALTWHERRPLAGARVALTRARDACGPLSDLIADLGGEAMPLPVTGIESLVAGPTPEADRLLGQLSSYAWLLLTSANAVNYFFDWLLDRDRDARALAGVRIACVGKATARALRARGLRADVVPERGHGQRVAEALIEATLEDRAMTGARVLFPRALAGRPEAVDTLRAAGAQVDVLPVYRTVERTGADDPAMARAVRRLRAGQVQALGFFAPSQVEAFFHLLGDAAAVIRACPIIGAIGRTTRAALTARGVDVHVVPSAPDGSLLVQAIARAWQAHPERPPPPGVATSNPELQ